MKIIHRLQISYYDYRKNDIRTYNFEREDILFDSFESMLEYIQGLYNEPSRYNIIQFTYSPKLN